VIGLVVLTLALGLSTIVVIRLHGSNGSNGPNGANAVGTTTGPAATGPAAMGSGTTAAAAGTSSSGATATGTGATTTAAGQGTPADLAASFARLRPKLGVQAVGLVVEPVGGGPRTQLGDWQAGPAWSSMKVPLALAALKQSDTAATRSLVHKAITESDNQAAESLWSQLGSGQTAAHAVDAVLAAHGDAVTRTQAVRVRPPYTPFGQTTWSLSRQVTFASVLACSAADRPVLDQMSQVIPAQRWGLGRLPGAAFKGGWGPDASGRYLVRQFGLVRLGGHLVAVAIAVQAGGSGTLDDGVHALNLLADWMNANLHPTSGGC